MHRVSYLQAINEALIEEMERDDRVFVMGEDVGWNLMGATGGLTEKFGKERVRNTPISEAGFVGAAAGAAMVGMRPVVDMLIAPFVYVAFDQFVSIIAKSTYLYGGQARMPLTVRAPMLYGSGNAAQHSDRPYATFMSIPGLKLIAPATPYDAKGMLKAAIRDDDPVISFEDGTVWSLRSEVPEDDLVIPLGQADIKRAGHRRDHRGGGGRRPARPRRRRAAGGRFGVGRGGRPSFDCAHGSGHYSRLGRQDGPAGRGRPRPRDGLGRVGGRSRRGPGGF